MTNLLRGRLIRPFGILAIILVSLVAQAAPASAQGSYTNFIGNNTNGYTLPSCSTGTQSAVWVYLRFNLSGTTRYVRDIRWYKNSGITTAGITGDRPAQLWDATSGTLAATATFAGESASGWQVATFSSPVSLNTAHTYQAGVFTSSGGYSVCGNFPSSGLDTSMGNAPYGGQNASNCNNGYAFRNQATTGGLTNCDQAQYAVDVSLTSSIATATVTPTAGPNISYGVAHLQDFREAGRTYGDHIELISNGNSEFLNSQLAGASYFVGRSVVVERYALWQSPDTGKFYPGPLVDRSEETLGCIAGVGTATSLASSFPAASNERLWVVVRTNGISTQCGGATKDLQLTGVPMNAYGVAWYDPYSQTCYGPDASLRGLEWQCTNTSTMAPGAGTPTATPWAAATAAPSPASSTAVPTATPAGTIGQNSNPDLTGAVNRQTDNQSNWLGWIGAKLGEGATAISGAINGVTTAITNAVGVPEPGYVAAKFDATKAQLDSKKQAGEDAFNAMSDYAAGLDGEATCGSYAGLTVPVKFGSRTINFTLFNDFTMTSFYCPFVRPGIALVLDVAVLFYCILVVRSLLAELK